LAFEVSPICGIKCIAVKFFKGSAVPAARKCPKRLKLAKLKGKKKAYDLAKAQELSDYVDERKP
jgi:hypothetical protein